MQPLGHLQPLLSGQPPAPSRSVAFAEARAMGPGECQPDLLLQWLARPVGASRVGGTGATLAAVWVALSATASRSAVLALGSATGASDRVWVPSSTVSTTVRPNMFWSPKACSNRWAAKLLAGVVVLGAAKSLACAAARWATSPRRAAWPTSSPRAGSTESACGLVSPAVTTPAGQLSPGSGTGAYPAPGGRGWSICSIRVSRSSLSRSSSSSSAGPARKRASSRSLISCMIGRPFCLPLRKLATSVGVTDRARSHVPS